MRKCRIKLTYLDHSWASIQKNEFDSAIPMLKIILKTICDFDLGPIKANKTDFRFDFLRKMHDSITPPIHNIVLKYAIFDSESNRIAVRYQPGLN